MVKNRATQTDGLRERRRFAHVEKILPVESRYAVQLAPYEEQCLNEGYEGVMIRTPHSPYKCGRST
jgi:ATP-dependent DNA ligase